MFKEFIRNFPGKIHLFSVSEIIHVQVPCGKLEFEAGYGKKKARVLLPWGMGTCLTNNPRVVLRLIEPNLNVLPLCLS